MGQYAFLIDSTIPALGPGGDESAYEVVLEAKNSDIPVFWLALFVKEDVRSAEHDGPDGEDPLQVLFAVTEVATALRRAHARRDTVLEIVGAEFSEAYELFVAKLERFHGPHVIADVTDQVDLGLMPDGLAATIDGMASGLPSGWLPSGFDDGRRPMWVRVGMVSGWGGQEWPPGDRTAEDGAATAAVRHARVTGVLEWVVPGICGLIGMAIWFATGSVLFAGLATVPLFAAAIFLLAWWEKRPR